MEEADFTTLLTLLEGGRFSELRAELAEYNAVDIAEFLEALGHDKLLLVFRILPKNLSADVFAYLETDCQTHIVETASDRELRVLIDDLFLDDTVDFLEEVPANVVKRVLTNTDAEMRNLINQFLQYPEYSAGSIMTIEMVELHDRLTVDEAIAHIRRTGVDKETIYTCYVIDDARHLLGLIQLRHLLLNAGDVLIRDLMDDDEHLISVRTLDDQEDVADLVRKYDLLSVPVVDNENRLVGIITIDDIVDVIEEENTEDLEKMNLLTPAGDETYLKTSVFKLAKNRILWLLILMVSATLTGKIIEGFQDMLAVVVGLTASIPMLMDTGGNAGSQTSTLVIRNLALGEIQMKDYLRILWKEVRVALICGLILAVVNFLRMLLIGGSGIPVYLVVCAAMFCAVLISKTIGCSLPIFAKLVHLDPALMAGPMITTIVDAVTLAIYFTLAKLFLL